MTKRFDTRDPRQDPSDPETVEDTAERFRVDRVYASPSRPRPRESVPAATIAAPSATADTIMARPKRTSEPPSSPGGEVVDTELSLRRQLSRLQRQFADGQRELANKEDELAAELEHRLLITAARDKILDDLRDRDERIAELAAYATRTTGIEQRLAESIAFAEELGQALDGERAEHNAAKIRVEQLTLAMEEARVRRIDERAALEEHHADELELIESQRREAAEAAEAAMAAATSRMSDAFDLEQAELRAAHERSLATLRGELEPKVLEARNLAEERERLASEITALKSEAVRTAAELSEAHKRELTHVAETYANTLAVQSRAHATELTRALGERDLEILDHQKTVREAELREQHWDKTTTALRETQKRLLLELAESKERITLVEAEQASVEERLGAATIATERLAEELDVLREQLEASRGEARRNLLDRQHFIAYLEDGLNLLGVAPPPADPRKAKAEDPNYLEDGPTLLGVAPPPADPQQAKAEDPAYVEDGPTLLGVAPPPADPQKTKAEDPELLDATHLVDHPGPEPADDDDGDYSVELYPTPDQEI